MKKYVLQKISLLFVLVFASACGSQATQPPTVDTIGTIAVQLASQMQTQTAAAYSPTPPPATQTPIPTATETIVPTPAATSLPEVVGQTPCYTGPATTFPLTSNITATKKVEIVGIGSAPGWYAIKNPYFGSICWVNIDHLKLDPNSDFSNLPVISP